MVSDESEIIVKQNNVYGDVPFIRATHNAGNVSFYMDAQTACRVLFFIVRFCCTVHKIDLSNSLWKAALPCSGEPKCAEAGDLRLHRSLPHVEPSPHLHRRQADTALVQLPLAGAHALEASRTPEHALTLMDCLRTVVFPHQSADR